MKKYFFLVIALGVSLTSSAFSGQGSGTESDPYQVTNADELFEVRGDLAAYYKLMNDIDLTQWIQEDNPKQGWNPIGNATGRFSGTFDGNNHSIRGLYINRPNQSYIGLFGSVCNATIKNIALINPQIIGGSYVGGLVGDSYGSRQTTNITNAITIAGHVEGSNYVGGILGYVQSYDPGSSYRNTVNIDGCYSSTTLIATGNYCGGIVGGNNTYYPTSNLTNNQFAGTILSQTTAGGIIGFGYYGDITCNVSRGSIRAEGNASGIVGEHYGTIQNNVSLMDTIYSKSSAAKITTSSGNAINNYAYIGTIVYVSGKQTEVADDAANGSSFGLKTLKRQSTYEGLGFDFTSQWTIDDGKGFPYNINQCPPVEITSFETGSKAKIAGTSSVTGTVYVIVDGYLYAAPVVNGASWEVPLGNVSAGVDAYVSVDSNDKLPSVIVKATSTGASTGGGETTQGVLGDANGDEMVDAADVVSIVNHLLGKTSSSFNETNADVNVDGQVLIDDAVGTVQIIMNQQ